MGRFFILLCALAALPVRAAEPADSQEELVKQRVVAGLLPEEKAGFLRMRSPGPTDWLSIHPEPPQTVERYRLGAPARPTAARRTIVLFPLGTFNAEQTKLLAALREYAEAYFQLPVRLEPPQPLPAEAQGVALTRKVLLPLRRDNYETQYSAEELIARVLKPAVPRDALVCLGITMEDLYAADLRYVHGLGLPKEGLGVYSLCRFFPEFWNQPRQRGAETAALRRACKVLSHEIGHALGLAHCVFFECVMNGANSLEETDEHPLCECPVCHRKLLGQLGFEPAQRFAALRDFCAAHGLDAERDFLNRRLANWARAVAAEKAQRLTDE